MKTLGYIIGGMALAGVGAVVFLASRKAVAASKAAEGFEVTPDCSRIKLVDQEAAKSAATDGLLAAYKGMDEPASDLLVRLLGVLFPQCTITGNIVLEVPGYPAMTISAIRLLLYGQSVGDVKDKLEMGGSFGLEGTSDDGTSDDGTARMNAAATLAGVFFGGVQ